LAKTGVRKAPEPQVVMVNIPVWDEVRNEMIRAAAKSGLKVNAWLNRILCRELGLSHLADRIPRRTKDVIAGKGRHAPTPAAR
jgi:hypothetical protein